MENIKPLTLIESLELIDKSRDYAIKCHEAVNHKYDGKPYVYTHIEMVKEYAVKYAYLLPQEYVGYAIAGAYTHDTIEDTMQTYNNVKDACGEVVAEITYALTNEKGKTRKERANDKYYQGIRDCYETIGLATFDKICDRLANVKYSTSKGSGMASGYAKEMHEFRKQLFDIRFKDMFDELYRMTGYVCIGRPEEIVIGETYYWKTVNNPKRNGVVTVESIAESPNRGLGFRVSKLGEEWTEFAYKEDLFNY
jgi:hypothetical protein